MKKLTIIILLLALSQISKSQTYYTATLNGGSWDGYCFACFGSTFSATASIAGSNSTFSYFWYNADTWDTLSTTLHCNLSPGNYVFEIRINGVVNNQQDLLVMEEDQMVITPTLSTYGDSIVYNVSTYNGHDGSISLSVVGGSTPYSYLWSSSATSYAINTLTAGIYSVTVTNNLGCTKTSSFTLTQPPPLNIDSISSPKYNNFNISENGKSNGKINLVVSGGSPPYNYKWFPFGNPTNIQDTLPAREYTVVVTDNSNATVTRKITLTEPPKLGVSLSKQDLSCHGCSNGSITATASGGVTPYSYLWSSGQTTATISNLQASDYVLVVTDANGAKVKESTFLKEPDRDDWSLTGNTNIQSSQFIGTTDSTDLILKTHSSERMRILGNGNIKLNSLSGTGSKLLLADYNGNLSRFSALGYLPASGSNPELFSIGHDPVIINTNSLCPTSPPSSISDLQLNGHLQCLAITGTATPTAALQMWFDGVNGNIDMSGSNTTSPDPKLLLNFWCGADVHVGNGSTGNLYADRDLFVSNQLGVGTSVPSEKFEVAHDDSASPGGMALTNISSGTNHNSEIKFKHFSNDLWSIGCDVIHNGGQNFFIYDNTATSNKTRFIIDDGGRVGIYMTPPTTNGWYKLFVNGGIAAREVKVTANTFPDYVFEKNYNLISINDLKEYIRENKHLPGFPSSKEVKEDEGFEVGKMQTALLEKLEEQALYIIDLKNQLDELNNQMTDLKGKMTKLLK